jgi:Phosphodiester glycosidase
MSKSFLIAIHSLLLTSLAVTSCTGVPLIVPTVTPAPTQTPLPAPTATPVPISLPDTGWNRIRDGMEDRIINIFDETGQRVEYLYILRLEPEYYQFDVAYRPEPHTLEAWRTETEALLVVNGGFFRKEEEIYLPNGLTVVSGFAMGNSYSGYGGMLAITDQGPQLRWLVQRPYDPSEPLRGALQSFPILVKPGGELGFPAESEDFKQARRTVIAQDQSGRILFIVTPLGYFTLYQLSAFLTNSDLNLDIALNLDGGMSTGLLLSNPRYEIPANTLLPIVIIIRVR